MPIYEYQCTSCGETTEALQKLSDPLLTDCPACGKATLKKKVSAAAFRLKGGGWYETDFKSGNKKNIAGDGGGDGKSDGKGGDKPADKSADTGGAKSGDAKSSAGKSDSAGGSSKSSGKAASDS